MLKQENEDKQVNCETEYEEYPYVKIVQLRKGLQRFNEDLGQYINQDQRHKLGRVLTIIDASIADPEQRKAIKDLVNNEWWNGNNYPSECKMSSPHTDVRGLCLALGFELYPAQEYSVPLSDEDRYQWVTESYKKTINEQ